MSYNPSAPTYKIFQGIVSQSGTAAPTYIIAPISDFGGTTFTWGRTSAGLYTLTANTAVFTANQTTCMFSAFTNALFGIKYVVTSSTVLTFTTGLLTAGAMVATDAILLNTQLEIRVYP